MGGWGDNMQPRAAAARTQPLYMWRSLYQLTLTSVPADPMLGGQTGKNVSSKSFRAHAGDVVVKI